MASIPQQRPIGQNERGSPMAAKAKSVRTSEASKSGAVCWLCKVAGVAHCLTCEADHCGTCPCECAAAVSASIRYWVSGRTAQDAVHVMADVGQKDRAVCGEFIRIDDWKGVHQGSFHKAPPKGVWRCQGCFSPPLPTADGWGVEATTFWLQSERGAPRPERIIPGTSIRHWKFHNTDVPVEEIRIRTDRWPTPARLVAADADQAWPDVTARLGRLNTGSATASDRMLWCIGQASKLRGDAKAAAMAEAQAAMDAIYAFEIALAAEESIRVAYAPFME